MHDIWNPWHGCKKISEGCLNCYMFYMDKKYDKDGSNIYKTKNFYYPLSKNRKGEYKIKSGDTIAKIAPKYNVSVQDILSANPNVNPSRLMIGQEIVIPVKK